MVGVVWRQAGVQRFDTRVILSRESLVYLHLTIDSIASILSFACVSIFISTTKKRVSVRRGLTDHDLNPVDNF